MSSEWMHASHVRPGDRVTGIWSHARNRLDPIGLQVYAVDEWKGPEGDRLVTFRIGPQDWQLATYNAETTVRVTPHE